MTSNYDYTPLHVHSDASMDGAGTVQSLVKEAKRLNLSALALTDHGTLANAVAFWFACTEMEIKPLLGMEAYFLYEGERHHLTLLSLSEKGFDNLIALDTWSQEHNHSQGYPLVTLESLEAWSEGLYALTGCASSALYKGDLSFGLKYTSELCDVLGRENVATEVMFVGTHDLWNRPMVVAEALMIPYVITNDTHYPCRNQFPAHQAICKARRGFTYDSQHLWLKSADEIAHEASRYLSPLAIEQGLNTSIYIDQKVTPWDMKRPPSLPVIPNVEAILEKELTEVYKWDAKKHGKQSTRLTRLRLEFQTLRTKGFLDYVYILWDIVKWAKSQGIIVGPGRGSGGGSYLLYLLGITQLDPIEYGLMFERFLNPGRTDYPDVDVDFEADRRDEVLNYAHDKWGTMPIATYSCYSHKSAVHDIARVLAIPKDLEIPASEGGIDSPAFEAFINDKKDALVTYNTMLGQIRHRGKHAAGVIIPNRSVPIERTGDKLVAAWAEGMNTKDLSKVGLVKYDLLGLTSLTQLRKMGELSDIPMHTINWDYADPKVFDLFCEGDVAGIFQWTGSEGIRELTQRIAPRNFYDLTTCNALYRPGALDAGTAEHYPEFMKEPRKLHPRLDPILEKTYGVLCYQEQVMAVVAEMMGGDLGQADLARRLLSKSSVGDPKWEYEVEVFQVQFIDKSSKQGFDNTLIDRMWHEIYTHSRYSYNLSHASAYTSISYKMAWYKVYHREAFTVAMLQYDKSNAQTYIIDAISHGLKVVTPDVNQASRDYVLANKIILVPLSDVAFLGEKSTDFILTERDKNGPFTSYENFVKRVPKRACNNRAKVMLERIGAFRELSGNPASAIDNYTSIPVLNDYQNQLEILGYIIPTPKLWAKIEQIQAMPTTKGYLRFSGFIKEAKRKKSSHGEYTVYNLSPSGSFWMRGVNDRMKVGAFVTGTKSKFGHSSNAKVYRIGK